MQSTRLLPTAFFGPIEYYATFEKHHCLIEVNEFFIKQSIRTRCEIYGANGIINLKVPKVRKNSNKTLIKDLKINYDHNWQKEHWKSIKNAYQSAPFFEYYCDDLIVFFEKKYTFLIDLNIDIHQVIATISDLKSQINKTNVFEPYQEKDLRKHLFKKHEIKPYEQVFSHKNGFIPNLSILDLLFNLGPETQQYISQLKNQ